ncbi:cilia- and flagella-associated protein 157-like isoform X1 [Convolutriloba macropyga]|uniref:cilia- and flagella-associated protein 157-like isoform X1 n=1 Tax=Convolutriloba macropyga TaxID=536237 RepID=UPI003F528811
MGKKKGGKKGKKKSGKASAKSIKSAISEPGKEKELDVNSKDFWQKQVDDLDRQVADYQKTCDLLEVNNLEKVNRLEQLGVEKDDIHAYLAKRLEEKSAELQELTRKLFELQQVKDAERESYEAQLASLESEYQETKFALTAEQENLSNKLGSMKEYEVQRAELMAKFAKIEDELNRQLNEQQKVIYDLERQMVVDKDRLRREAADKVTNLATEFRKVSDKQMEDTKKRALRENVQLNKSLQRHSDRTVALIEENDAYKYRAKQNQLLVEMLEFNEKELSRKFNKNVQQIRIMLDKCKGMEGLIHEYETQTKEFEIAIQEHREAISGMEQLKARHDSAESGNEELRERIDNMRESNIAEAKTRRKLENLLLDTAKTIKMSLPPDPKKADQTAESAENDQLTEEQAAYATAGQREVLIHHLMRILNSASNMGVGPQAAEFQVERPTLYTTVKSQTTIETDTSNIFGTKASRQYAGYKGGVLGLVPLPGSKRASATEFRTKREPLSATRRSTMAGVEPVLMRSIACQTVSVPKAIFMARRKILTEDEEKEANVKKVDPLTFHAPLRK